MKSTIAKICFLIGTFGLILSFSACNKTKDPGPAVVKFTIKQDTYTEAEGTANIEVALSRKLSKDVDIDFTWAGSSTTYLDGDFKIASGTITIVAGQLLGHIQVDIIDDAQLDDDDALTLTLTTVSTGAKLSTSSADLNFDLTITNNDNLPNNTLQADLTWDTGAGEDIDKVDLDLNLQQGVVFVQGTGITNPGTTYIASQNSTGFESLLIIPSDPDSTYWFYIPYYAGSGAVDFTLTLNGFGWNNQSSSGSFTAADAVNGYAFIGPFTKTGNTFPPGRSIPSEGHTQKMLVIKGSDLRFKKTK